MSDGPVPSGLSHITFIVADLDRMEEILGCVLGAEKIYDSGARTFSVSEERFFLVGAAKLWIAIMKGEPLPARSYNHLALKIEDEDFDLYRQRIEALGLDLRQSRPRVDGEGRSLYFHDHDNHLFELHTGTLSERLARYATPKQPESKSQHSGPSL
ncbi:FosX/FosE/FosI family fosfomycin resistance thiol transferase [Arsenicitalea aurantiaca]|uniref:FosX/FosE/FosI family fosfomycin resistance thiol transferase n=1 Tax=Arsenicitalea aurantiaca TaxID=1783274 RepID=A0A433XGD1_9HYPH|nr:FosX/FosE/FosI family fosfomycin resistance hydrolase [Arsenicitalea aurantiaca]RUT33074.1 FosX/FosE/FosI family fosfomycin resistance thiol transferase [Arsenicitalea aurantiaca]